MSDNARPAGETVSVPRHLIEEAVLLRDAWPRPISGGASRLANRAITLIDELAEYEQSDGHDQGERDV